MPTVFITGASGFIGTTLRDHFNQQNMQFLEEQGLNPKSPDAIPYLSNGEPNLPWEVIGLDREHPIESWHGQVVECADLLHYDTVEELIRWYDPDHVLHMAAQARVGPSMDNPLDTYRLNVEATLNVLEACEEVGVPHVITASSEAIYGEARSYPTAENDDFRPANPYAASKVAADVLTQQFNRTHVDACVARSGMGWGPRQDPSEQVVAKFICAALDDESLKFPEGDVDHPTRDLNYVFDFARGIQAICEQQATGVYNLSGGREYSVLDIAERIVDAVGSGHVEFVGPEEFSYREGEEGFRTWLDVSKAEEELGHAPKHHLEGDALRDTIDWFREHRNSDKWQDYWGV